MEWITLFFLKEIGRENIFQNYEIINLSKENWNHINFEIVHEIWNHSTQHLKTIIWKMKQIDFQQTNDTAERTEIVNFFQKHSPNKHFSLMTSANHQMIWSEKKNDFWKVSLQKNPSTREVWIKTAFVVRWPMGDKIWKISIFLAYLSFYAFYELNSTCVVKLWCFRSFQIL